MSYLCNLKSEIIPLGLIKVGGVAPDLYIVVGDNTTRGGIPIEDLLDIDAGGGTWGTITGTVSDQIDLQLELDGKADVVHTHAQSDITGLISSLAGKADILHTHNQSDITGLTASLAGKVATTVTVNGHALSSNVTVTPTDLSLVIGTNVQAQSTNLTTYAGIAPSANVQSFLGAASYSAMRTLLTLVPGTDVQTYSANLAATSTGGAAGTVLIGGATSSYSANPTVTTLTIGTSGILLGGTNLIEQRNGVNAQTHRQYYTYTDASNYSRLALNTSSTGIEFAVESLGTGYTNGDILFTVKGTGKSIFRQPGGVAGTDEVWLLHDGSKGILQSRDGTLRIRTVDGTEIATSSDVVQIKLGAWAQLGSGGLVSWSSTSTPGSDDTGIARVGAAAIKVTNASSGIGSITASHKSSDGSAGVSAGPYTIITAITVKDGIITAITGS